MSSEKIEILSNYVVTSPRLCKCAQCDQLQNLKISNTLSNAESIFLALKPILHLLNIEEINDLSIQHSALTCQNAKDKLCSYIINRSIKHCTNSDTFHLSGDPILIFKYHYINKDIVVQFAGGKIQFCLSKEIQILPGQISQLNIAFYSDLQVVPDIESNLDEKLAISPQNLFSTTIINGNFEYSQLFKQKLYFAY